MNDDLIERATITHMESTYRRAMEEAAIPGADFAFNLTVPTGCPSECAHRHDVIYTLNMASNDIWRRSAQFGASVMLCDDLGLEFVRSVGLPVWRPLDPPSGRTVGRFAPWSVMLDATLASMNGASPLGNLVMVGTAVHSGLIQVAAARVRLVQEPRHA